MNTRIAPTWLRRNGTRQAGLMFRKYPFAPANSRLARIGRNSGRNCPPAAAPPTLDFDSIPRGSRWKGLRMTHA